MDGLVKERLRTFIASRGISVRRFELLCGFPNSFVANMKRTTSPSRLEVIAERFPELNISWLMTGKGEMLNPNVTPSAEQHADSLAEEVARLAVQCDRLLTALEAEHKQVESLIEQNSRLIALLEKR
ncbi:MAG: hypothetical protein IJ348_02470 [Alistipes sp.]|nr:hypothetical protein [Alistipes sp.]